MWPPSASTDVDCCFIKERVRSRRHHFHMSFSCGLLRWPAMIFCRPLPSSWSTCTAVLPADCTLEQLLQSKFSIACKPSASHNPVSSPVGKRAELWDGNASQRSRDDTAEMQRPTAKDSLIQLSICVSGCARSRAPCPVQQDNSRCDRVGRPGAKHTAPAHWVCD